MALTFHYENNKQGLIITAKGIVDGKDFLNNMKQFFSDEQIVRNYRYGLNDFTQLEKFNISPSQIYSLAKLHIKASKINSNIIVGFAIHKTIIYGLVRIWTGYPSITGWRVNIEKTVPEIRNWIDTELIQNE